MTISIDLSLPSPQQLPSTFAIFLDKYSAISFTGEEQSKYLQGQVTCDVNMVNDNSLIHGAHCDAKGKVFSVFRFINRNKAHLLLQSSSSISASLAEFKKFGVFAKVDISETSNLGFLALVGDDASAIIQQRFAQVPDSLTPVIQIDSTTIVYIAGQYKRYLLIDKNEQLEKLCLSFTLPIYNQAVWDLLEINDGFPILSETSISEYVPQMLNLQAINGISFTKGCYLGQETVARMQYLGKNKRALFCLQGSASTAIEPGDIIEKQLGENWRKAGDVLANYQADDTTLYVQAVLANDIESTTNLRIKSQPQAILTVVELPYSIIPSN